MKTWSQNSSRRLADQKWDTALKHLDRILDVSPGNLRLRLIKMNVLLESGKSEQLVAEVTGAIEASWDEPKRLDLLAWTIAAGEGEKPKAALEAAARAAQHAAELTNNKDVSILDTLGASSLRTGRPRCSHRSLAKSGCDRTDRVRRSGFESL